MNISQTLKNDFVIIDLGSSLAKNNAFLRQFFPVITSIEIDALSTGDTTTNLFHKSIKLKKGINTTPEKRTFYERKHFPSSSFLKTLAGVPAMYGMEESTKVVNEIEMECVTLPQILQDENIKKIDFFKTDLEGLDLSILKSAEEYLNETLVIQSELRFQPFFETESFFFETCAYLNQFGFELISIMPEYWKYKTKNRNLYRDGRIVFGDFIFFKKLTGNAVDFPKQALKQILLAKSLGLNSHAEYLFELHGSVFTKDISEELGKLLKPTFSLYLVLVKIFNFASNIPGYSIIRKGIKYFHKISSTKYKQFPWWTIN